MKIQKMAIRFKVHKENINMTMTTIENLCNSSNIKYTYSITDRFFPMKSVINAEFEGQDYDVDLVYKYIKGAHGAKLVF